MSTSAPGKLPSAVVTARVSPENLLFDYPGADVILRSCDSYEFRVLKFHLFHSSPVLAEQLLAADNPQSGTAAASTPVVQLPHSGAILFSLLTYIFPVPPILPSTVEQITELLSAAQKYKMDATLIHIRNHISQQHPPFIREENSLYIYSLAQRLGLRQEMLQAARSTLGLPNLTLDSLGEKLELMPGASLLELRKYHQRVRVQLKSDLRDFIKSRDLAMFEESTCRNSVSGVPSWLYRYIFSIGRSPNLFDLSGFYYELTDHIQSESSRKCSCAKTFSKTMIPKFWTSLSEVYRDSITKVRVNDARELG